jgi:hypothetical protein
MYDGCNIQSHRLSDIAAVLLYTSQEQGIVSLDMEEGTFSLYF